MYKEYNAYLTTLDKLRVHIRPGKDPSYVAADDTQHVFFIQQASQEIIDSLLYQLPLPYLKSVTLRRAYLRDNNLSGDAYEYHLTVPDNILSITSITWVGTALTSSQYRMADENTALNRTIAIDRSAISRLLPAAYDENVTVVGIWGYVPHWVTAWVDSTDAVTNNPLESTDTTLNVTAGTKFEEYQYIRIEDEYLLITEISTNALTVERGVLGTTAAEHAQAEQIDRFVQQAAIGDAATEYAAYLNKTKNNLGEQVQVFPEGTQVNNGLSKRLLHGLRTHRYHYSKSA